MMYWYDGCALSILRAKLQGPPRSELMERALTVESLALRAIFPRRFSREVNGVWRRYVPRRTAPPEIRVARDCPQFPDQDLHLIG